MRESCPKRDTRNRRKKAIDGQRISDTEAVDIHMVPVSLVERIDVLTGARPLSVGRMRSRALAHLAATAPPRQRNHAAGRRQGPDKDRTLATGGVTGNDADRLQKYLARFELNWLGVTEH
jgi:sigma54-dependent transcription regulator